jgi:hypothetical protein
MVSTAANTAAQAYPQGEKKGQTKVRYCDFDCKTIVIKRLPTNQHCDWLLQALHLKSHLPSTASARTHPVWPLRDTFSTVCIWGGSHASTLLAEVPNSTCSTSEPISPAEKSSATMCDYMRLWPHNKQPGRSFWITLAVLPLRQALDPQRHLLNLLACCPVQM